MQPEQALLHFKLTQKLGQGGMGVVWKATDTTLGREVAIKILPPDFAADEERLGRFDREARLLASLNHPNIAGIYGIHKDGAIQFLAMELVPGEDLSQALERGPLPLEQALRTAREIAAGLEAAHDNGVIHRDLKPANVKLTAAGSAKVLDFGLAKAAEAGAGASGVDPSLSPTLTSAGTRAGMILGTASYMSPEQAAGQPVDRRCDIWSFGVLLHELLTGRRLFEGETVSHILAAVLRAEIDLDDLPKSTPSAIRRLLLRCLERDPSRRLRDIGEARILLDDVLGGNLVEPAEAPPRSSRLPWLVAGTASAAAIVLAVFYFGSPAPHAPARETLHLDLAPPEGTHYDLHYGTMAVSPDGKSIAFLAEDKEGRRQLWVRDLREAQARKLDGTEGAWMPFWSPDGKDLGFGARNLIKRVPAAGGPVDIVTPQPMKMHGAAWVRDGEMLVGVARGTTGLYRVLTSGETPQALTELGPDATYHSYPCPIPGTDAMLMTQRSGQGNSIMVKDGDAPPRELMPGDSNVAWVEPGFILYWRDGALRARPFDRKKLAPTGEPRLVAAGVATDPSNLVAHFAVAGGTLAYIEGAEADSQSRLVLRNRKGEEIGNVGPPGNYYSPDLSPDGKRLAVDNSSSDNNGDIWIYDLDRPVGTRVTRLAADESSPAWSPDGRRIVFWSTANGQGDAFLHRVGDSAVPSYLFGETDVDEEPHDWSSDGRTIALVRGGPEEPEVWLYDLESKQIRPLQEGGGKQRDPAFSPDGRYVAYTSTETGRDEVYLRSVRPGGRAWQVSLEGGDGPHWRADGKELFFYGEDGFIHAVAITLGKEDDEVTLGRPQPLFRARIRFESGSQFDVFPDGQTFVINSWMEEEQPRAMSVVLGWRP